MVRFPRLPSAAILALSALILLTPAAAPLAAQEAEAADEASATIEQATEAASAWLALIDDGAYEESWKQAASAFQDAVTPAVWHTSVSDAREPLEPFGERTLIGSQQITDPPGAPRGDYVILQYRTEVAGDRTAVETVVPMKEGDAWKVSGYFVQPE